MIIAQIIDSMVKFFIAVLDLLHLPVVTRIPFGVHDYFIMFVATIKQVADFSPLFATLWNAFMYALGFSILIFTIEWTVRIYKMIRG